MDTIRQSLNSISVWLSPHQEFIIVAIASTILVLGGGYINQAVKSHFSQNHFIIRTIVFILLCSIGYGFLATFLNQGIGLLFQSLNKTYFGPVVILIFLGLGILAERK